MSRSAHRPVLVRLVTALFGLLAVVAAAVSGAGPAAAHAGLLVAVPAPGDEVGGAFDLQLYFGEPVETVVVEVLAPDGSDIVIGQKEPIVGLIEVEVAPMVAEGVYVVTYDVSYSDGAEFDSIYQFTYTADGPTPLALVFDDLEPRSSTASTIALWVLVGASTLLVLLLGWRVRQIQVERALADERAGADDEPHNGTAGGAG